ncbi:hypothetical protein [Fibrobacter sp. UWB13]|uniref:hypothetical protein n=1 Tax=Fibrobacter sp. UWB13 TaxID=1896204 RepID=UPI000A0BADA2|nr:hypothetical protein [Fibrobacter sp. UWB13]SMG31767.1 hypothetical protein SAMN05720489_2172 [Fibrobacter sp. UWB13]
MGFASLSFGVVPNIITNNTINKKDLNSLAKRFEKVVFKDIFEGFGLSFNYENDFADEIVSSFKLEPFDDVPAEKPVEFTAPGFEGEFGDGADAKGDGVV